MSLLLYVFRMEVFKVGFFSLNYGGDADRQRQSSSWDIGPGANEKPAASTDFAFFPQTDFTARGVISEEGND